MNEPINLLIPHTALQALVDVGVPAARLVTREEAYLILPPDQAAEEGGSGGMDKAAVLSVMEGDVAPRLAVPAWQREVAALVEGGKDGEAVALGARHGLGVGDVLYSKGKSILHDVCRRRDAAAVAFCGRFVAEEMVGGPLKAEEDGGEKRAMIPVNDVGLTPFDYLHSATNF